MTVKQIVNPKKTDEELVKEGTWVDFAIQAPEGTEIKVNDAKIIIGTARVWEMPDNISVTSLKIIKIPEQLEDEKMDILIDCVY